MFDVVSLSQIIDKDIKIAILISCPKDPKGLTDAIGAVVGYNGYLRLTAG